MIVILGFGYISSVNAGNKQYMIDFVVLNEGKTLADRAKYERLVEPILARYGARKVQSYKLDSFMGGQLKGASQLNIYEVSPDSFAELASDEEYKKHVPFRNNVHDMDRLTLYTGETLFNHGQLKSAPLLIDLIVMNDGYGHPERFDYEEKMGKIAVKHGAQIKNSFDIDKKIGGIGPDNALKLNIWTMSSPEAMQMISSDPEYKKLTGYRNKIHDMDGITLYMASPIQM